MSKPKLKRFYFHFNKPQSKAKGKPQISIHYNNKCMVVDNIICMPQTCGKIRKRQPYFVMEGWCYDIDVMDGIAFVYDKAI